MPSSEEALQTDGSATLESLPHDAFARILVFLSPTSRRLIRRTCKWAREACDRACEALDRGRDTHHATSSGPRGQYFSGVKQLVINTHVALSGLLSSSVSPHTASAASPPVPGPTAEKPFVSLSSLALTHCVQLDARDIGAIAASCRSLSSLHVYRADAGGAWSPCQAPAANTPQGGALEPGLHEASRGPGVRPWTHACSRTTAPEGLTGLILGRCGGPWALTGLTFAPLGRLASLHELGLHGMPCPLPSRPLALPAAALMSLGPLTQLRDLTLAPVAANVDLHYVLTRLVGLTRLDLTLLAAAWQPGGHRRQDDEVVPSLAGHTALSSLALRMAAPYSPAALLPPELYGMLLSADHDGLASLHLDLPPPPPPPPPQPGGAEGAPRHPAGPMEAAAAWAGTERSSRVPQPRLHRLAPRALTCHPKLLSCLLDAHMSLRYLEALRLYDWHPPYRPAEGEEGSASSSQSCPGSSQQAPAAGPGPIAQAYGAGMRRGAPPPEPARRLIGEQAAWVALVRVGGAMGSAQDGPLGPRMGLGPARGPGLPGGGREAAGGPPARGVGKDSGLEGEQRQRLRVHLCVDLTAVRAEMLERLWDAAVGGDASTAQLLERLRPFWFQLPEATQMDLAVKLPERPTHGSMQLRLDRGHVPEPLYGTAPATAPLDAAAAAALAAAYCAAARSPGGAFLRWLPYQLPNLYGLALPYNELDERGVALLALGLRALRRLALGRVKLSSADGGGLKPLGSLPHLTVLRFGGILFQPLGTPNVLERGAAAAAAEAEAAANADGVSAGPSTAAAPAPAPGGVAGAGAGPSTLAALPGGNPHRTRAESSTGRSALSPVLRALVDCCGAFPSRRLHRGGEGDGDGRGEGDGPLPRVLVVPPPGMPFEAVVEANVVLEADAGEAGCDVGAELSLHKRGLEWEWEWERE